MVKKIRLLLKSERLHFSVTSENDVDVILGVVEAGITSDMEKPWTLETLKKKLNECIKKTSKS